ncbi:MAG TPA: hypothetical protein VEB01_16615, partial [Methylocaldum sp.]|nr:hypothetical protein [Methylocaldum sp.]
MIGGIVAVLIAYWFYRSAEDCGLSTFQWAFAGLLAFYVPNFAWSLLVAKPWVTSLHAQQATFSTGLINFSSVALVLRHGSSAMFGHVLGLMIVWKPGDDHANPEIRSETDGRGALGRGTL